MSQLTKLRLNIGKVGSGFTEGGSACDRSRLFANTKHNQVTLTTEQTNASLREVTERSIKVLIDRKLLNVTSVKRNAIVVTIDSNDIINETSCKSRITIQDGFISTGEISKSLDGKGINSCPDLHAMIKCTKNKSMLNNVNSYIDKVHKMARSCVRQGDCTEEQYGTVFNVDRCPDKIMRESKFTCNQYHLMRCVMPYHFCFIKREIDRRKTLHEKKKSDIIKKYDNLNNTFTLNEDCENKLLTVSNNTLLNDMTVNHFSVVTAPLLKAFMKVRMIEDLTFLKESDVPKKRVNWQMWGLQMSPFLYNLLMSIEIKK